MTDVVTADPRKEARTVRWVAFIACTALVFDGFDLTIYGTVLTTLLNDPSHIGPFDAATAGLLGSYALVGVLFGSLLRGAVGDYVGRRRLILVGIAWFSIGMCLTAMSQSVLMFGALRFFTGLGLGAILATAGATIAEFAPAGRRNFYNAIVYSGIPAGGVLAAFLGILLLEPLGWRWLFAIGGTPILFLLPLALFKLPESPRWPLSRGNVERAEAIARKTGIPLVEEAAVNIANAAPARRGFAAIFSRELISATLILGLMSFSGLLLTYGLNTWLPRIMEGYGYGKTYSLGFLLALNSGAVIGGLVASRLADRSGPQRIVASTFVLAAAALLLMTFAFPLPLLVAFITVAGVGTLGTQVLIYGFTSNYFTTNARAAGVAWCSAFGRLGGVFGPLIGGWLVAAGIAGSRAFYIFAGVALFGAVMTVLVPKRTDLLAIEKAAQSLNASTARPQDIVAVASATANGAEPADLLAPPPSRGH